MNATMTPKLIFLELPSDDSLTREQRWCDWCMDNKKQLNPAVPGLVHHNEHDEPDHLCFECWRSSQP